MYQLAESHATATVNEETFYTFSKRTLGEKPVVY